MPTALLAAGIGAAGSLFGGQAAASAADKAAQTQLNMYNSNKAIAQPWINGGQNALNIYENATGQNGTGPQSVYFNSFQNDPYLTGIKNAGIQGIENSDLARGRGYGGNLFNDLNRYSMDIQKNAYDQRLGQIWNTAEAGRGAAAALAGQGTQAASAAGNYLTQAGLDTGASYMGAAKAFGQGLAGVNWNGVGNNLNSYFGGSSSPVAYNWQGGGSPSVLNINTPATS